MVFWLKLAVLLDEIKNKVLQKMTTDPKDFPILYMAQMCAKNLCFPGFRPFSKIIGVLAARFGSMTFTGALGKAVVIFSKTFFLISSKSTANLSQKTVRYPSRKGVHYIFFGYHRLYLIIAQNVEKCIMHPFFGGILNSFLAQIICTFAWNQKKVLQKMTTGPQGFPHYIYGPKVRQKPMFYWI